MKMNFKFIKVFTLLILFLISINVIYGVESTETINDFKDCSLCRQKIEDLYQEGKIDVIDAVIYEYDLDHNPYNLPDIARCEQHKFLIKSIDYLYQNAEELVGKKVKIDGIFQGWRSKIGPPPVTRSDWIIADATGEIYVSGNSFPIGLHPGNVEDRGKKLVLTGTVRVIENYGEKNYYLEMVNTNGLKKGEVFYEKKE